MKRMDGIEHVSIDWFKWSQKTSKVVSNVFSLRKLNGKAAYYQTPPIFLVEIILEPIKRRKIWIEGRIFDRTT